MVDFPTGKPFTAEIQRQRRSLDAAATGKASLPSFAGAFPGVSNNDILAAIKEMHADLRQMAATGLQGKPVEEERDPEADAAEAAHRAEEEAKLKEVTMLKTGIRALNNSIQQTKIEIAALRHPKAREDRIIAVTSELDAIVSSTEGATQSILDFAEKIDTLATSLKDHTDDRFLKELGDEIMDHTVKIFESCNFQDITGQRITKIVNTLKFIEDRVMAMITIWGAEQFEEVPMHESDKHDDEDKRLLNGPQLEHKAISQDEIDKLFG